MLALFMTYFLLLVSTCGYAVWQGGKDGRIACAIMMGGSMLTYLATLGHPSRVPLLMLDIGVLAAFTWLALRSRSYWPLWVTGFHLITVAEGVASLAVPSTAKGILHAVTGFWAVPMLLAMSLGIFLDRRTALHADAQPSKRSARSRKD
jgi:hypothetical protein